MRGVWGGAPRDAPADRDSRGDRGSFAGDAAADDDDEAASATHAQVRNQFKNKSGHS